MEMFMIVMVVAVLVEAVVQAVKVWVPEDATMPRWLWPVVGAGLGVLMCVLASVDVFGLLGVDLAVPLVGQVLSGVLVSRGASFMHDLWGRVKGDAWVIESASLNGVELGAGDELEARYKKK